MTYGEYSGDNLAHEMDCYEEQARWERERVAKQAAQKAEPRAWGRETVNPCPACEGSGILDWQEMKEVAGDGLVLCGKCFATGSNMVSTVEEAIEYLRGLD